jgi:hypothetical protein
VVETVAVMMMAFTHKNYSIGRDLMAEHHSERYVKNIIRRNIGEKDPDRIEL